MAERRIQVSVQVRDQCQVRAGKAEMEAELLNEFLCQVAVSTADHHRPLEQLDVIVHEQGLDLPSWYGRL